MKNIFNILVVMCLSVTNITSQVDPKTETSRLMTLLQKLEGTYQVQIIDSRELPTIPLSLMDTIEAKRDETSIKFVWLASNVRVKILPRYEIGLSTFQGLPRVTHISSSDLN